ncbi:D-2-hydroxyacid dehydrogenase [Parachitinimonas caeni]|uniref:D-2-hydroxyacid dehydrogenase n=1 Tax=Parachitinimonas caeni TaxID=3031301 RepID=A0ABT7DW68_9NEIS|nr:D-2-hydroxyacid dehydrogenase [Parachitinimonas caeni]MDK2124297.1 D-2-hydroxyacid dehydrogenase [Parachitinimonas caeni]
MPNTPSIVFLDRASLPVALRQPDFPHIWREHASTQPDELLQHAGHASILISNKVRLDAAALAELPHLKLIAVAATGYNMIDVASCRERGIAVCNIRGYADNTVPEHALMLMLALRRQLPAYRADLQQGAWQRASQFCHFGAPVRDLHGATLALIGSGLLGEGVARLARAFGMRILLVERRGAATVRDGYTRFEQALAEADVISLHCPLTDSTRNLIGEAELALMKPEAILINTARGGLIDETALLKALQAGQLGGAGLDVLIAEPPTEGNPLLDARLPNLIITPHIAWASRQAMEALAEQLIGNIEAFMAGQPRNLVTA